MKAVITVIGKDSVGILAKVSEACSKADVNIVEVTQNCSYIKVFIVYHIYGFKYFFWICLL